MPAEGRREPHGQLGVAVPDFANEIKPGVAKVTDMKLDSPRVVWADANTAVLMYTWTGKGTYMGKPVPSPVYASTVYTKRADKWVAVFHQETTAAPPPPKK